MTKWEISPLNTSFTICSFNRGNRHSQELTYQGALEQTLSMKSIVLLACLLGITGCDSTNPSQSGGEQPVRYAKDVKVATYDITPRPPTTQLNVLREASPQKHHTIATLTIEGDAENEANLINALAWKARQLGADSLLLLTPSHPRRDEWIFRADALLMDPEK